jgi:sugar O-acyltransferase (sialic acid O-acetyltransferase NeuD family)
MGILIIIGAGGHGKVLCDLAEKLNKYDGIAFLDDNADGERLGYPIIGRVSDAEKYTGDSEFIVAIGNAEARGRIMDELTALGVRFAMLVHPSAVVGKGVTIGAGSVVVAGAVINPMAKIGRGCIINTHASVDHDCEIGDLAHIAPGATVAGETKIGARTWVGAGATVVNGITVSADCTIGAGAVVIKDITEVGTYVGVPAKKI